MKQYTAVATGLNKVKVFDIKSGVTSYHINLESKAEITNVQCPGNSIAVTFKDGYGRIKTNVYNDIKRGILSYSNTVGSYDVPKPTTAQSTVNIPPAPVIQQIARTVTQPANENAYTDDDDESSEDQYNDINADFDSAFERWKYWKDVEWNSKPLHERFLIRTKEMLDISFDMIGRLSSYILFFITCFYFSKNYSFKGNSVWEAIGWFVALLIISWLATRATYNILTYVMTKWVTAPLATYIAYYYLTHR